MSKKFISDKIKSIAELELLVKEAISFSGGADTDVAADSGTQYKGTYDGPLVVQKGAKRYMVDRKKGLSPQGFWDNFRSRLQTYVNSVYPEVGLKIKNLGVTRDLAQAADRGGNKDRVSGSKHGAGLAQDVYLHTQKHGKYTSYKKMNPILAKDQKLVDAIIDFMALPENIALRWGGAFGSGSNSLSKGQAPKGRGITEFHHFEYRQSEIPKFFEEYDDEIKKLDLGLTSKDMGTTKNLAKLYTAIAEGRVSKAQAAYLLENINWEDLKKKLTNEAISFSGLSRNKKGSGSDKEETTDEENFDIFPDDDKSLTAVDPNFRPIVVQVMDKLKLQGFQPILGSAYRSPKSQKEKIAKGYSKSKTIFGYHVALDAKGNKAARAVDLVDKRYGWKSSTEAYDFFEALGKIADSAEFKNKITWGGSWDRKNRKIGGKTYNIGWDPAHIQTKAVSMAQSGKISRQGMAALQAKASSSTKLAEAYLKLMKDKDEL